MTVGGVNNCSLREAIRNMNDGTNLHPDCAATGTYGVGDTINVPNLGQYILNLVGAGEDNAFTGDLDVNVAVTIQGPSPTSTAFLNGQSLGDRVFHVRSLGVVNLLNVAINSGSAATVGGGGILNEGMVTLTDVSLSGNDSTAGGYALHSSGTAMSLLRTRVNGGDGPNAGAGITITAGTLNVTNSLVDNSGGTAPQSFGIRVEGGSATIVNSTISRNAGIGNTGNGGGLFAGPGAGTVTLNNVTLADNRQGIERQGGAVRLANTLIAENSGANCTGTIVSDGHNLSDDATCTGFTATGDLPANTDAKVEETFGSFGGPTPTHALLFGSPAVDAGNPGTPLDGAGGRCVGTDQRGVARPQDGDVSSGPRCDIGAFELLTFVVTSTTDDVDVTPGNLVCATATAVCTLRAAVQEANAVGAAAVVLPASGTPYTLSRPGLDATAVNGDLDVTRNLAIIGGGAATTIIDGNGTITNDRVFEVQSSGNLVIQDVTIRNGNAAGAGTAGDGGGIRALDGRIDVRRTAITGNRAARNGGGIASESIFVIEISDSTIAGNTATGDGGGISLQEDTNSRIRTTTVSGNQAANGGGLRIAGSRPSIENLTVSGNQAAAVGGGILVGGDIDREVEISSSTIANNQAATAGGLRVLPPTPPNIGAHVEIDNSIVANNTGGDCVAERITSNGHNLSSTATCGFTATGDQQGLDPRLGPLADNGGPTQTRALLVGSPALEGGHPDLPGASQFSCSAADQRGLPRPRDGDGIGQVRCDIGAFEQQTPLTVDLRVTLTDSPDPVSAGGEVTFTATVTNDGPLPASGVVVTVDSAVAVTSVTPGSAATCTPAVPTVNPIACTFTGAVANGASVTVVFKGTAPATGPFATTAQAHGAEPDPNPANNQAEATTTVRVTCAPRPQLEQSVRPIGNRLEVLVRATTTPEHPANALSEIRFTRLDNARVSIDNQPAQAAPFILSLTPSRQSVLLVVERVQGGVATTVSFEAVDECGAWPTFVGGGPGAF